MRSSTVRIDEESQEILEGIKEQIEDSAQGIIHRALESYRRELFLKKCREGYLALKADAKVWDEETKDGQAWDQAANDSEEEDK